METAGRERKEQEVTNGTPTGFDYFATKKKTPEVPLYDRIYHVKPGYDSRQHRDDRRSLRSLATAEEEKNRTIPVLTSSLIGKTRGVVVDTPGQHNSRISTIQREFYSRTGPPMPIGTHDATD